MTCPTGLLPILVVCPFAVAVGTCDLLLDFEFLLDALVDLLEVETYPSSEVSATHHVTPSSAREASEPAEVKASAPEEVAEAAKYILHGHTATTEASASCSTAPYTCVTELVIPLAFLWVTQYVVGLGKLLELLLCLFVSWIFIWVVLDGELAVGFLELFIARPLADT